MKYTLSDIFNKKSCKNWGSFWLVLSNFLDCFKREPNQFDFSLPCEHITPEIDAFIAATIEQLMLEANLPVPSWVYDKKYILENPFFPSGLKGDYRFIAIKESPLSFSVRQIFVTKNVLDRV